MNAEQERANQLGVSKSHLATMQAKVDKLERENDYIGDREIRQAISDRLVEIRLLLRDGHLGNLNGGKR